MIYNEVCLTLTRSNVPVLPAYAYKALKALREQLNIQTSRLGPKSRFTFSPTSKEAFLDSVNRKLQSSVSNNDSTPTEEKNDNLGDLPSFPTNTAKNYNAEMADQPGPGIRKPSFSAARDIDISAHRNMHIILPTTAARATTSGSITDLQGCVLDMSVPTLAADKPKGTNKSRSSPFASLAVKNVSRSLIVAGHVAGPAHITGVKNSVLVVNARQVRMHECENVRVWLWCGSRPIIEGCKGVRFAEIPGQYVSRRSSVLRYSLYGRCANIGPVDRQARRLKQPMGPCR